MRKFLSLLLLPAAFMLMAEESNLDMPEASSESSAKSLTAPLPSAARGDAAIGRARSEAMKQDRAKIDALLKAHGSFAGVAEKLAPAQAQNNAAAKENQSRWFEDGYFVAGSVGAYPVKSNFVRAVVSLDRYLKEQGVDLIVVRVPNRNETAFGLFGENPLPGECNAYNREVQQQLLDANIEYIDGLESAQRERGKYPLSYWYPIPREGHPAEGLSMALAGMLAERLTRYQLPATGKYHFVSETKAFKSINFPPGNPKYDADKPYSFGAVRAEDGSIPVIGETNDSPLLFISDSYGAYPAVKMGASIPHYLLGRIPHQANWMYRNGSSQGASTFLYRKGLDFVKNRQVVVLLAHPGNLNGVSELPPPELRFIAPERMKIAAAFEGEALKKIADDNPAIFKYLPEKKMLLFEEVKWGKQPEPSFQLKLPAATAGAPMVALEIEYGFHNYNFVTASCGDSEQIDVLCNSERVDKELFVLHRRADEINFKIKYISPKTEVKAIRIYSVR